MSALYGRNHRALDLLVTLRGVEPLPRRPVRDRLRDSLGADLLRILLLGLAQRARSPRRAA